MNYVYKYHGGNSKLLISGTRMLLFSCRYSLSTHFSRTSTEKTVQIDCESLLGSSNKNSLHIWVCIIQAHVL